MLNKILQGALYPGSIRQAMVRKILAGFPRSWLRGVSYKTLLDSSVPDRPEYGYCMYNAAQLAAWMGHKSVTAIEFGVAAGNGLLAAERHAREITRELGVEFQIYGFDTGGGLPPPEDYRDLPFAWRAGDYPMDQEALRRRLTMAQLVLGPVRQTCPDFFIRHNPAPIGCIFWDLDFYSSTMDAFQIFQGEDKYFLPRLSMYFDDVVGFDYCDFTGERLAITDFNAGSPNAKISPEYWARLQHFPQTWKHQIFTYHNFAHPDYCRWVWENTPSMQQVAAPPLR
jgi:hypothetical protein